ncbi:hypothetical protein PAXINDRAFT_14205 [Paxillus involutus ATCC 200175]|uniref:Uncharacterized protein n=1 Tax=Paxillus involutus ATCC 200175 TaxID=664439 RepID=A0A0C9TBN0_PAXIN|nr:hypothetical protein PAXINDRAFT_14205 [Paxillus involutus ATCC 200175]
MGKPDEVLCSPVHDVWLAMIRAWENDMLKPNPFYKPKIHTTRANIHLKLAEEEAADAARGILPLHEVTLSAWLHVGLDLEEQNSPASEGRPLRLGVPCSKTSRISFAIVLKTEEAFSNVLEPLGDSTNPECLKLHLPFSLQSSPEVSTLASLNSLCTQELQLHIAQADDALEEVHRHRHIIQGLYQFKKTNISSTGNRTNTRTRAIMNRFVKWTNQHVSGPGAVDGKSEGHWEPLWIWQVAWVFILPTSSTSSDSSDAPLSKLELNKGVHIEWTKAWVWAEHWREEKELVAEEM